MISRERIKEKIDIFNTHFNFKDFIGLSALIFGLLLANSSIKKNDKKVHKNHPKMEKSLNNSRNETGQHIKAEKRKISPPSKSQRKTAAHRRKNRKP